MAEGRGIRYRVELRSRSLPGTVHYAAETANFEQLDALCKKGLQAGHAESVTLQERESVLGLMPIHIACEFGKLDVVEYLMKKRVDLEAGDNFRTTAMHLAAVGGHLDVVKVLLAARCDANPVDAEGDVPMHWAATKGHVEVIQYLLKNGGLLDSPNKAGWTPLHRAAYNGRVETIRVLCKAGARLGAQNKDGNSALHLATLSSQLAAVETLCQMGVKHDIMNLSHKTAGDLCMNEAQRDLLAQYNWGKLLLGSDVEKAAAHASEAKDTGDDGKTSEPDRPSRTTPRRVAKNDDGFPDMPGSPAKVSMAKTDEGNWSAGDFYQQTSREQLELQSSHMNPYASAGSGAQHAAGSHAADNMGPSTSSSRRFGADANGAGSSSMKFGFGPPLPPIATREGLRPSSRERPSSSLDTMDYQDRLRAENRRAAAEAAEANNGTSSLTQRGGLHASEGKVKRPVSGNKKFLSKYNLGHMGLFGPSGN